MIEWLINLSIVKKQNGPVIQIKQKIKQYLLTDKFINPVTQSKLLHIIMDFLFAVT